MTHQEYYVVMNVLQQYRSTAIRNQESHGSYTPSDDQIRYNKELEARINRAIEIFEHIED